MPELPATLLPALLALLPSGVVYYTPCYDATGVLVDFTFTYLNPAAQQQLGLPAQPTVTYLQQWPGSIASGAFAFHRDTFLAGTPDKFEQYYQAGKYTFNIQAHACRVEEGLLVTFADVAKQPRLVVEETLRRSHIRARIARSDAERQRGELMRVFEQAPIAIAVYRGPTYIIELANPTVCRLWGRRQEDILGLGLFEALPEVAGLGYEQLLDRVMATGEPHVAHAMEAQHDRNGQRETVYWDFVYVPMYEADGSIYGAMVVANEVTTQVLARQQVQDLNEELAAINEELTASNEEYLRTNADLLRSEQQLRRLTQQLEARVWERTRQLEEQRQLLSHILGQVPAFIATFSGQAHHFTFFNEAYQRLAGGRAQLGFTVAQALPEAAEQGFMALLDQVYTSGEAFVGREVPFTPTPSATPYYLDFTYQPLTDGQGQVQGILAFAVDVTEQVLAKQQREIQQRLVETVFAQAPTAIWVVKGPDYVFELLNPPMAQLLGRSPEQALGQPYFEVLPELVEQGLPALFNQAWHSGEPVIIQELPARLARHAAGETGYFTSVFQPLRDERGQVVRLACVATDVTDQVVARRKVENLNEELLTTNEELHGSNRRLEHLNADLDTFVYTASHDLKLPITNVEGLLAALREHLPAVALDELVLKLLDMMEGAVHRFQDTLGHLTDVARLQNEPPNQATDPVDLPALLEAVRLDMLPELTTVQATLTVDLASCPKLLVAAKTLRSVFYNLLSNAVKYRSPDRLPLVQVRCHSTHPGQVAIEVQDNGLGLTPQQQGELFRLFRRLHTHVSGSGVGLYMVKRLVENTGGTLTVQSQVGVGSTFTVTLPISQV